MVKFKTLLFRALPNGAHYSFFEKVNRELADAGADVKAALASLLPEFNKWFAMEYADLEWYRKSQITASISDASHRLDHAISGLLAHVNSARYNTVTNVAIAAEHIHIVLKSYGSISGKSYQDKIGKVDGILGHLNNELYPDMQTIGGTAWIGQITSANNALQTLLEQRDAEQLGKPESGFRETRKEIETVWRQIILKVNSAIALAIDSTPQFEAFVDALNPEIDRLNHAYHHAKIDIAAAEPAPIDPQQYTGQPITPALKVLFVTPHAGTVKLELGKDYNVTYKNNVNVGNSEATIHGKGEYRGQKTVTFVIVR